MHHTIRVLLVEDSEVVRSALTAALFCDDTLEVVGEAENGQQAVEMCARLQPDLVMMDLLMPVMDGIEATRRIRAARPETCVVALTSFGDENLVQGALEAGVIAYLLKTVSADELTRAIHAAYEGKPTLHPDVVRAAKGVERKG